MRYDVSALDAALTALFDQKGYPGVSVAIWGPEGPAFEKGYGFCDLEKARPVDQHTLFGVASMSKSMTSLCCCLLAVEGKLSFDDPVVRYFPQFWVPGAARQAVTLHHLATHTAGIPPMEPLEWSIAMHNTRPDDWNTTLRKTAPNPMETLEQVMDYIAHSGYESLGAPGEVMSYCNEGYAILSYVVDQAAGMPLERFLQERVFEPLGMTRTVLDLDASEAKALSGGNITSLFEKDGDALSCDDDWSVLPPFRGCAQVKSTARDMAVYYRCLASGGLHEGKRVFPAEAVDMLIGKGFAARRRPTYCYGLNKRTWQGHVICEHAGGLHGVSTYGGLLLGEGWGFSALCNQGDVSTEAFFWILVNFVLGRPLEESQAWMQETGAAFEDPEMVVGSYLAHEGVPSLARIFLKNGALMAEHGERRGPLAYCGNTIFRLYDEQGNSVERVEPLIRNGKAWASYFGTRVYQRVPDPESK